MGTKTAVQIRSHAQKFFSKLTKGTAAESEYPWALACRTCCVLACFLITRFCMLAVSSWYSGGPCHGVWWSHAMYGTAGESIEVPPPRPKRKPSKSHTPAMSGMQEHATCWRQGVCSSLQQQQQGPPCGLATASLHSSLLTQHTALQRLSCTHQWPLQQQRQLCTLVLGW
jgi:hypothetical protein